MKYILSLIILFLSAQLISQPYLNETSRWKQYFRYVGGPPTIYTIEDIVLQIAGDTMIGSTPYYRLLKTGIRTIYYANPNEGDTIFHGPIHEYLNPIREGLQTIYAYSRTMNKEYLLYDFSAEVGDTLKSGSCERDTVISIDTLFLGDLPRRQFHLPSPFGGDISTLVEGVGSTFGFYYEVCNVIPTPSYPKLQCYSQDGDYIRFDSTYDCNNWLLADEVIKEDAFSIRPNPFTDEIEIHFPDIFQKAVSFAIVNLMGAVVFEYQLSSVNSIEHIALPDLPAGMYIISVRHQDGVFSQKMMKL